MSRQMLIDAAHPEETRVVTLTNNRLEEFDLESASKKQLKGNIYLAKVTRVEPSLQAAFVDYGGTIGQPGQENGTFLTPIPQNTASASTS